MKKQQQAKIDAALDKALAPPKPRKQPSDNLNKLLGEYGKSAKDLTRLNSHPPDSTQLTSIAQPAPQKSPVAPERDFNRRANSLERDALPANMFPGTSKKLYDALYLKTRGAIKPTRTIQARRSEIMRWAGIGGLNTFLRHMKHFQDIGLIVRHFEIGDKEGAEYEVKIPEEIGYSTYTHSTQLDSTQPNSTPKRVHDSTPNLMRVESSQTIETQDTSALPKTSLKTTTNDDEGNPLAELTKSLIGAIREITGADPATTPEERERWRELGEMLVCELRAAAAHSKRPVSSVPAFLTAHLRRRFTQRLPRQSEGKRAPAVEAPPQLERDPDRRLTPEEISSFAETVTDLLKDGATLEEVTAQFAGSLHPEDWEKIRSAAVSETR